jgi:lysophospholipase L1-like esterase
VNPEVFGHKATWTIENDSAGLRGPERTADGGADVYRILCVGDSVTFGFNVDQPDPYPRRLEALLRERHPGKRIEVLNAGVPGWSWVQGLRFVEAYGLAMQPDLVIAAHGTNDQFWQAVITDRERLPAAGVAASEMRQPTLLERTSLYRLLSGWGRRWHGEASAVSPACRDAAAHGESCRRVSVPDIEATIAEMREHVRAAGSELIVANMDFMETPAVNGVRNAASAGGLPFVDLVAEFRRLEQADEAALAAQLGLRPGGAGPSRSDGTRRVLFRVQMPEHADAPVSVRGSGYFRDDVHFELPLRDDGTNGDEVAGDRVFSGTAEVGADVAALEYTYWLGDTAEFTPLPPLKSTSGTRIVRLGGETVAPVVRFAERARMAERTHPNAAGQAVIAAHMAALVEAQPSFQAWLGRL